MPSPVSSTRDPLYASILESPDEDAPRLVYADWLEEHGDSADQARAEYIRLGCRLASLRECDEGYMEAKLRAERLHDEHWLAWRPPVFPGDPERRHWTFTPWDEERGLPARLQFDDDDGDAVRHWLSHLPITRAEFTLKPRREDSARLLADPAIAGRFRELDLRAGFEADDAHRTVARIFRSDNLRRLVLGQRSPFAEEVVGPSGIADLLAGSAFRRLTSLTAVNETFGPGHFYRIAMSDLPELTDLQVGQGLTPESAATLARAPWFSRLNHLTLTRNKNLTDAGLAALLDGARDGRLRSLEAGAKGAILAERGPASLVHLRLGATRDTAGDFLRIAHGPYRLESLRCSHNIIAEESEIASRFFSGPAVAGLRQLNWGNNHLGEEGAAALAAAPFREHLRVLILTGANLLTDLRVRLLCSGPPWKSLAHLDLTGNPISAEAALALIEHPKFARLVSLALTIEERAHVFVKNLARSRAATRLRGLHLDCQLTPGAVKALIASPHLDGLEGLLVDTEQVSGADKESTARTFRAAPPPMLLVVVG